MGTDTAAIAELDAEPGELPATMAAWVLREEREGELEGAFRVEEVEAPEPGPFEAVVRFRTIGDATCTAAVASSAFTVEDIVAETAVARVTERGATRADDRISEAGMEDRKRQGYF